MADLEYGFSFTFCEKMVNVLPFICYVFFKISIFQLWVVLAWYNLINYFIIIIIGQIVIKYQDVKTRKIISAT